MLIAQIAFIILFGIFTEYDRENLSDEELTRMYPWFQEQFDKSSSAEMPIVLRSIK